MLYDASKIRGYAVAASDGELGTVSDFLFDDASWLVRWLAVDTSNWLTGRKVLLPTSVLGRLDLKGEQFSVKLSRQQVKDSPDVDADGALSRQVETNLYEHYGWSPYLGTGVLIGGHGCAKGAMTMAPALEPVRREENIVPIRPSEGDRHLRSIEAVTGCHIHATDGEIGHVDDFLLEDTDWSIRYLIVNTSNWWSGQKVLISPRSAREFEWADKLVNLDVDRQRVKDSPAYDTSITVDGAYEEKFLTYYGIRWAAA